jgi:hypothetical protein
MKIKGPDGQPPPVDPSAGSAGPTRTGTPFEDSLIGGPTRSAGGGPGAAAPGPAPPTTVQAGAPSDVRDIAAKLRGGEIDARQALDRLIDRAVERVAAGEDAEVRRRVREALHELAMTDPLLAEKVRRLGPKRQP